MTLFLEKLASGPSITKVCVSYNNMQINVVASCTAGRSANDDRLFSYLWR